MAAIAAGALAAVVTSSTAIGVMPTITIIAIAATAVVLGALVIGSFGG
ncbi:hypothetical protein [Arvimicrobium flavum]|nr:hypothetical protein [Mesorhizobium shangrilense]